MDTAWTEGPTLSAWIYDTPRGAAAGRVRLDRLRQRGAVVVADAATVTWVRGAHRARVSPALVTSPGVGDRRSPLGALLARLVTQAGPADPAAADGSGGLAGLARLLEGSGLDEGFLRQLREALVPDSSALVVLTRAADEDDVQRVVERGVARGDVGLLHAPLTADGLATLDGLARADADDRSAGAAGRRWQAPRAR